LAALALAGAGALLLVPLPAHWHGGWRGRLFDLGHVPLFAALTALLGRALGGGWLRPTFLAVAAAALGEVAQLLVGRSASLSDFLLGASGALAAGLVLRAGERPAARLRLAAHSLAALALVAAACAGPAPRLIDAAEGFADFPTLADFRTPRQMHRWRCEQAELVRVPDPDHPGRFVGRLTFRPGPADYPGAMLEHIVRDAGDHRRLCWSFTVEGEPLTLVFSLRGGPDAAGVTSHYQVGHTFGPGTHRAEIDLALAAARARPDPLDHADLWWSQVFVDRPARPRVIYLHRVWLE
jgi:hypothetical protein